MENRGPSELPRNAEPQAKSSHMFLLPSPGTHGTELNPTPETRKAGLSPPYDIEESLSGRAGPGPADDEADDTPHAAMFKDFLTSICGLCRCEKTGVKVEFPQKHTGHGRRLGH